MAQINNSDVIQKLVDELQLYPGKDIIPSELAEKILPVFQINSEEITVSPTPANIINVNSTVALNNTQTLYTVPSTGKFFLTNVALNHCAVNSVGNTSEITSYITITPVSGSAIVILKNVSSHTNAAYGEAPSNNSLNLQNPIELEPGSTVTVTSSNTRAYGSMIGYTEAD